MDGTGSTAARGVRRWFVWWLAWFALCCAALEIIHLVGPHSLVARGVLVAVATIGSAWIFGLRRRRSRTRTDTAATVLALIILVVTISSAVLAIPVVRAFLR